MPDNALYERVKDELNRLCREVRGLRTNQHVFWEVQNIIRENPYIHKPSTFYTWMGQMYVESMTATIRRLIDSRKDTVSLIRLLKQIRADPSCFSRSAYKGRCTNPDLSEAYIDVDYDKLVGEGKQQPDKKKIEADIAKLKKQTEVLKQFVDERVAHSAKEQKKELPRFQDLDDSIEYVEQLLKWYNQLVTGAVIPDFQPSWLYDWKAIFRYPWIRDDVPSESTT